jgi:hypothetical protein
MALAIKLKIWPLYNIPADIMPIDYNTLIPSLHDGPKALICVHRNNQHIIVSASGTGDVTYGDVATALELSNDTCFVLDKRDVEGHYDFLEFTMRTNIGIFMLGFGVAGIVGVITMRTVAGLAGLLFGSAATTITQ